MLCPAFTSVKLVNLAVVQHFVLLSPVKYLKIDCMLGSIVKLYPYATVN